MSENIFEKWNKAVDTKEVMKEIEEAANNTYPEIPHGDYVVKVAKMEVKASSKGDPMFSAQFKIVDGEYKGQSIFMNQVLTLGFQFHIVNEFLRSLDSGLDIEFDGDYNDYHNLILDVFEAIDGHCEYELEYKENNKGYNAFRITAVYDA